MENEFQELLNFCIIFIFLNLFLIVFNQKLSKYLNIYDKPDTIRKFHHGKPSIIGGVYLFINLIFFFLTSKIDYFSNIDFFFINSTFIIGLILIFTVGIFDDKYNLKPELKLFLLTISVLIFLTLNQKFIVENINFESFKSNIQIQNFSLFFTVLCILLFMNSFNMMDGINLLAGVYSIIFLLYVLFFINFNHIILIIIIFLIFYLYLNNKNLIFFGDSGSLLLSFLISVIIIFNHNIGNIFAEEIFILMLLPGLDMFRLFLNRAFNKKNPFSSDRNHLHHLLLNKFGKYKTIIFYNLFYIVSLILYNFFRNKITLITLIIISYLIIIYFLTSLKKQK